MLGNLQTAWLGPMAVATIAFVVVAAFRSSDWVREVIRHLILGPIQDILRLSW